MQIDRVDGCTRVCGKAQGFLGLPLRDETLDVEGVGLVNQMVTAWFPTPEELEALNAGAPVHVKIWGNSPPPMMVETGDKPE
jgi:hypothetical protein